MRSAWKVMVRARHGARAWGLRATGAAELSPKAEVFGQGCAPRPRFLLERLVSL